MDVDKDVLDLVVAQGYDGKYGARALKRQLQQFVIMPIATLLMERRVEDASILRLTARHGEVKVAVLESEHNKAKRREAEPVRLADGAKDRSAILCRLCWLSRRTQLDAPSRAGVDLPGNPRSNGKDSRIVGGRLIYGETRAPRRACWRAATSWTA